MHNSLASYFKPSLGRQKSHFLRVLMHSREYVTVKYNDFERSIHSGESQSSKPLEYSVKKARFIKKFVHSIRKKRATRQSLTSNKAITGMVELLSKKYD